MDAFPWVHSLACKVPPWSWLGSHRLLPSVCSHLDCPHAVATTCQLLQFNTSLLAMLKTSLAFDFWATHKPLDPILLRPQQLLEAHNHTLPPFMCMGEVRICIWSRLVPFAKTTQLPIPMPTTTPIMRLAHRFAWVNSSAARWSNTELSFHVLSAIAISPGFYDLIAGHSPNEAIKWKLFMLP